MTGYIYCYKNSINNKVYIGQTTNIKQRQLSHKSKAARYSRNNKFYNAIKKYGMNTFIFSIIEEIIAEKKTDLYSMLDDREIYYIKAFDSYNKGYNSTFGGHSNRGIIMPASYIEFCHNRTFSKETRKKMSISAKSRKVSEKTREKHRANAIKRNFSKYRKENKEKIRLGIRKALAKPVLQINPITGERKCWEAVADAAREILRTLGGKLKNIINNISKHCRGLRKSLYNGFVWKYNNPIV